MMELFAEAQNHRGRLNPNCQRHMKIGRQGLTGVSGKGSHWDGWQSRHAPPGPRPALYFQRCEVCRLQTYSLSRVPPAEVQIKLQGEVAEAGQAPNWSQPTHADRLTVQLQLLEVHQCTQTSRQTASSVQAGVYCMYFQLPAVLLAISQSADRVNRQGRSAPKHETVVM